MKTLMERLRNKGAHSIIRAYFIGLMLWIVLAGNSLEWIALWVLVLILGSSALLALVFLGGVGSTWDDR